MAGATEVALLRPPPGLPLPEHLVADIFSILAPRDRARFAQACRYTAHVSRTYHVFADIPCLVTPSNTDRVGMAVEQRRRSVRIRRFCDGDIVPVLQAFCEAFASLPYQVCNDCNSGAAIAIVCCSLPKASFCR